MCRNHRVVVFAQPVALAALNQRRNLLRIRPKHALSLPKEELIRSKLLGTTKLCQRLVKSRQRQMPRLAGNFENEKV